MAHDMLVAYLEPTMKKLFLAVAVISIAISANSFAKGGASRSSTSYSSPSTSSHSVRSYSRRNGTYVPSHRATDRDSSKFNNYSTRGNVNPYTGRVGTKDPYKK